MYIVQVYGFVQGHEKGNFYLALGEFGVNATSTYVPVYFDCTFIHRHTVMLIIYVLLY